MMRFVLLYILLSPVLSFAQAIDKTFTYEHINSNRYARFNYENDFFAASDRYYTQGVNIEVVTPSFSRLPVAKLLLGISPNRKYGVALNQEAYTPTSIRSNNILYGDRPFAGLLFLNFFSQSIRNKQQLSSTLSIGLLGEAAGGKDIQRSIHAWTNNIDPQGWQHQVRNNLILNYRITYEYNLLNISNHLLVNAAASARIGTLNTKAGAGATIMGGLFDNPFNNRSNRKFRIHIYERPMINIVVYDATMQGGLFNDNSPYTIDYRDVERVVFENRAGILLGYKKLTLEYFRSYITREFATGDVHAWGGVGMGIGF